MPISCAARRPVSCRSPTRPAAAASADCSLYVDHTASHMLPAHPVFARASRRASTLMFRWVVGLPVLPCAADDILGTHTANTEEQASYAISDAPRITQRPRCSAEGAYRDAGITG